MKLIKEVKDKAKRHQERHTPLGYQYLLADRIAFVNAADWDSIAADSSVFLSRQYLMAIEANSPENTAQKYAMAYHDGQPLVIIACQIAETSGDHLVQLKGGVKEAIARNYKERVLVCGNLVSSGLHGVGYSKELDPKLAWRVVAEALYKIRRGEKLSGAIDFVLIKDIKGTELEKSKVVERYSYRRIQTDPDMVLTLGADISSFDDYLAGLRTKYRSRAKKIIKTLEQAGFECEKVAVDEALDRQLHRLYMQVEQKSQTRLATLPEGYFLGLYEALDDRFACFVIRRDDSVSGFVSIIKDGDVAVAYYVGLDYQVNSEFPVYFRLLQLVIQTATEWRCSKVAFGRTALEPKASLGAKPVDTFVWARHRVPVVNFIVRKLFRNVPFDEAPERSVTKK